MLRALQQSVNQNLQGPLEVSNSVRELLLPVQNQLSFNCKKGMNRVKQPFNSYRIPQIPGSTDHSAVILKFETICG